MANRLNITPDILRRFKAACAADGIAMKAAAEALIEKHLDERKRDNSKLSEAAEKKLRRVG